MSDSLKKHPVLGFTYRTTCSTEFIFLIALSGQGRTDRHHNDKEDVMGKYFLAWLLGVPAIVLILIYFFMH
jgi:hypothetical protein